MIKEYFSSWRQHLNIGVAVFLSCLIHFSLIAELQFQPRQALKKICCEPELSQLRIKLVSIKKPNQITNRIPDKSATKQLSNKNLDISNASSLPVSLDKPLMNDTKQDENKYYATRELDIKALPISDFDASLLNRMNHSGLPIRLRVYISAYGKVIRVDKIAGQQTDDQAIEDLTAMLKQSLFIAAKKDGLNVNSYQDIEFSFIPQTAQ